MENEELYIISRLRQKDAGVMDYLFDCYYEKLYFFAEKIVYDSEQAHDIIQDVFLRLWERSSEIVISKSIKSYLFAAVKNECFGYLRSLKIRDRNNIKWASAYLESLNIDAIDDNFPELVTLVNKLLNELSPQCQEIYKCRLKYGLKYTEIASRLNISENVVKVQMHRSNKRLIALLQQNHMKALIYLLIFLA